MTDVRPSLIPWCHVQSNGATAPSTPIQRTAA
jgi:hypothetical protein